MKYTKETLAVKLKEILIQNGNSEQSAKEMIKEHLDYMIRVYSDVSPKKMAQIIICL